MKWLRREGFDLHAVTYWVLDTETTGFDVRKDRILSVGGVRVEGGTVLARTAREWFVRGEEGLGESPTIHGITREQLEAGVSEAAVWSALEAEADAVWVAHYAAFDRDMLEALRRRAGGPERAVRWLDTMDLETALHPSKARNAEALKLDTLLAGYGIEAVQRHSALGDAYSTALLLQRQLAALRARGVRLSDALHRPRRGLL